MDPFSTTKRGTCEDLEIPRTPATGSSSFNKNKTPQGMVNESLWTSGLTMSWGAPSDFDLLNVN